jgi:UDP-N-acetylenolpyruvoylglucosamine reductase
MNPWAELQRALKDIPVLLGAPLTEHGTWRIGGPAAALIEPRSVEDIENDRQGSAADVLRLITEIRRRVHARFDWWLETEVRYVMPNGTIMPVNEIHEPVG